MMMDKKKYDVMVIGGGPAGTTAAKELAKAGYKVGLIDKAKFPRDKTCGGLISAKTLEELDLSLLNNCIRNKINKISVYDKKMRRCTYESNRLLGVTIFRKDFDQCLLNQAVTEGVQFYDNTKFIELKIDPQNIRVFTSRGMYCSKYLIGCDGVFSKTRHYVCKNPLLDRFAMGFAISTIINKEKNIFNTDFKLFQVPILYSMGWAIPFQDKVNVGIGGPIWRKDQMMELFLDFIGDLKSIYHFQEKELKVRGSFLPVGGFKRKIINERILLAGDAAGFVDPLTGEGIYYAVRSGRMAAEQIIRENIRAYQDRCNKEFQSRLKKSLIWNLIEMNKIYSSIPILRQRLCTIFSQMM